MERGACQLVGKGKGAWKAGRVPGGHCLHAMALCPRSPHGHSSRDWLSGGPEGLCVQQGDTGRVLTSQAIWLIVLVITRHSLQWVFNILPFILFIVLLSCKNPSMCLLAGESPSSTQLGLTRSTQLRRMRQLSGDETPRLPKFSLAHLCLALASLCFFSPPAAVAIPSSSVSACAVP